MSDNQFGSLAYDGFVKVYRNETTEVVESTDSVAFLVYVRDRDCVVLVTQTRKPMITEGNPEGVITEVPAGRFDVDLSAKELIAKEASEELGAAIRTDQVTLLNAGVPLAMCPGILTERQTLAYVEVDSSQLESAERVFGVDADERITRGFVPVAEFVRTAFEDLKTFALQQWLYGYLRASGREV